MIERKPKVERQANTIVKLYLRRQLRETAHRAGVCGCPRCKAEPRKLQEWIDEKPEQS